MENSNRFVIFGLIFLLIAHLGATHTVTILNFWLQQTFTNKIIPSKSCTGKSDKCTQPAWWPLEWCRRTTVVTGRFLVSVKSKRQSKWHNSWSGSASRWFRLYWRILRLRLDNFRVYCGMGSSWKSVRKKSRNIVDLSESICYQMNVINIKWMSNK